jgi:hypothetical protein
MSLSMSRLQWSVAVLAVVCAAGCGGKGASTSPTPIRTGTVTPAAIDSLWQRADDLLRRRKWDDAAVAYERVQLEMPAGDPRIPLATL